MKPDLSIYHRVLFSHKFMEEYILSYAAKDVQALFTNSEFKKDREMKAVAFTIFHRYCGMSMQQIATTYASGYQYVSNIVSEFNRRKPPMYYLIVRSLESMMAPGQVERTEGVTYELD
jgi:capsule polysaccharide modification protein KpsS